MNLNKKVLLLVLVVTFSLSGCATQPKDIDPNRAELLAPAEVEIEQPQEEVKEPEKGFGYYAAVTLGCVFWTGIYVLDVIVHNHHR